MKHLFKNIGEIMNSAFELLDDFLFNAEYRKILIMIEKYQNRIFKKYSKQFQNRNINVHSLIEKKCLLNVLENKMMALNGVFKRKKEEHKNYQKKGGE